MTNTTGTPSSKGTKWPLTSILTSIWAIFSGQVRSSHEEAQCGVRVSHVPILKFIRSTNRADYFYTWNKHSLFHSHSSCREATIVLQMIKVGKRKKSSVLTDNHLLLTNISSNAILVADISDCHIMNEFYEELGMVWFYEKYSLHWMQYSTLTLQDLRRDYFSTMIYFSLSKGKR